MVEHTQTQTPSMQLHGFVFRMLLRQLRAMFGATWSINVTLWPFIRRLGLLTHHDDYSKKFWFQNRLLFRCTLKRFPFFLSICSSSCSKSPISFREYPLMDKWNLNAIVDIEIYCLFISLKVSADPFVFEPQLSVTEDCRQLFLHDSSFSFHLPQSHLQLLLL